MVVNLAFVITCIALTSKGWFKVEGTLEIGGYVLYFFQTMFFVEKNQKKKFPRKKIAQRRRSTLTLICSLLFLLQGTTAARYLPGLLNGHVGHHLRR
jgi:hypothetical protein